MPRVVLEARVNSVSPGGISSVVLGYLRFDGGATQSWVGKVSLFSDFIGDGLTLVRGEIYKACSLCIICVKPGCLFHNLIYSIPSEH